MKIKKLKKSHWESVRGIKSEMVINQPNCGWRFVNFEPVIGCKFWRHENVCCLRSHIYCLSDLTRFNVRLANLNGPELSMVLPTGKDHLIIQLNPVTLVQDFSIMNRQNKCQNFPPSSMHMMLHAF